MASQKPAENSSGASADAADDHHSVTLMIEQLRSEKRREFDQAAAAIWSRYFSDLVQLARRNLSPSLRQREDEHDLLQSMYNSFCLRQREGQYELPGREDLWNLLVQITRNKARNLAVRHGRHRRDHRRETKPAAGSANTQVATARAAARAVQRVSFILSESTRPGEVQRKPHEAGRLSGVLIDGEADGRCHGQAPINGRLFYPPTTRPTDG